MNEEINSQKIEIESMKEDLINYPYIDRTYCIEDNKILIKFFEELESLNFQKGKQEAINNIDTFMKEKTYCKESGDIIRILPFEWEELKSQLTGDEK